MININNIEIKKIYIGENEIEKAYSGEKQIYFNNNIVDIIRGVEYGDWSYDFSGAVPERSRNATPYVQYVFKDGSLSEKEYAESYTDIDYGVINNRYDEWVYIISDDKLSAKRERSVFTIYVFSDEECEDETSKTQEESAGLNVHRSIGWDYSKLLTDGYRKYSDQYVFGYKFDDYLLPADTTLYKTYGDDAREFKKVKIYNDRFFIIDDFSILYSDDGINWNIQDLPHGVTILDFTYSSILDELVFLVVEPNSQEYRIYTIPFNDIINEENATQWSYTKLALDKQRPSCISEEFIADSKVTNSETIMIGFEYSQLPNNQLLYLAGSAKDKYAKWSSHVITVAASLSDTNVKCIEGIIPDYYFNATIVMGASGIIVCPFLTSDTTTARFIDISTEMPNTINCFSRQDSAVFYGAGGIYGIVAMNQQVADVYATNLKTNIVNLDRGSAYILGIYSHDYKSDNGEVVLLSNAGTIFAGKGEYPIVDFEGMLLPVQNTCSIAKNSIGVTVAVKPGEIYTTLLLTEKKEEIDFIVKNQSWDYFTYNVEKNTACCNGHYTFESGEIIDGKDMMLPYYLWLKYEQKDTSQIIYAGISSSTLSDFERYYLIEPFETETVCDIGTSQFFDIVSITHPVGPNMNMYSMLMSFDTQNRIVNCESYEDNIVPEMSYSYNVIVDFLEHTEMLNEKTKFRIVGNARRTINNWYNNPTGEEIGLIINREANEIIDAIDTGTIDKMYRYCTIQGETYPFPGYNSVPLSNYETVWTYSEVILTATSVDRYDDVLPVGQYIYTSGYKSPAKLFKEEGRIKFDLTKHTGEILPTSEVILYNQAEYVLNSVKFTISDTLYNPSDVNSISFDRPVTINIYVQISDNDRKKLGEFRLCVYSWGQEFRSKAIWNNSPQYQLGLQGGIIDYSEENIPYFHSNNPSTPYTSRLPEGIQGYTASSEARYSNYETPNPLIGSVYRMVLDKDTNIIYYSRPETVSAGDDTNGNFNLGTSYSRGNAATQDSTVTDNYIVELAVTKLRFAKKLKSKNETFNYSDLYSHTLDNHTYTMIEHLYDDIFVLASKTSSIIKLYSVISESSIKHLKDINIGYYPNSIAANHTYPGYDALLLISSLANNYGYITSLFFTGVDEYSESRFYTRLNGTSNKIILSYMNDKFYIIDNHGNVYVTYDGKSIENIVSTPLISGLLSYAISDYGIILVDSNYTSYCNILKNKNLEE